MKRFPQATVFLADIANYTPLRTLTDDAIQTTVQFREVFILGKQNPTFEDKRRVLELLRVNVSVQDRKATIACHIPTSAGQSTDRRR